MEEPGDSVERIVVVIVVWRLGQEVVCLVSSIAPKASMSSDDAGFAITITNIPLSIVVGNGDAHCWPFIGLERILRNKQVLLAQACLIRSFRGSNVTNPSACPLEYQHGQDFEATLRAGHSPCDSSFIA